MGLSLLIVIVTIFLSIGVYFIPTIVAYKYRKGNLTSIFLLNLLLGWTFLGWVGALIWALMKDPDVLLQQHRVDDRVLPNTKQCPFCAESIKAEAIKCRFCGELISSYSRR